MDTKHGHCPDWGIGRRVETSLGASASLLQILAKGEREGLDGDLETPPLTYSRAKGLLGSRLLLTRLCRFPGDRKRETFIPFLKELWDPGGKLPDRQRTTMACALFPGWAMPRMLRLCGGRELAPALRSGQWGRRGGKGQSRKAS